MGFPMFPRVFMGFPPGIHRRLPEQQRPRSAGAAAAAGLVPRNGSSAGLAGQSLNAEAPEQATLGQRVRVAWGSSSLGEYYNIIHMYIGRSIHIYICVCV